MYVAGDFLEEVYSLERFYTKKMFCGSWQQN